MYKISGNQPFSGPLLSVDLKINLLWMTLMSNIDNSDDILSIIMTYLVIYGITEFSEILWH
jgi:hypothetical protein